MRTRHDIGATLRYNGDIYTLNDIEQHRGLTLYNLKDSNGMTTQATAEKYEEFEFIDDSVVDTDDFELPTTTRCGYTVCESCQ